MKDNITVCLKKGGNKDQAVSLANKLSVTVSSEMGKGLTVLFDSKGTSLSGKNLNFQADFEEMLHRLTDGRLQHEMLVKASKSEEKGKAIDATAGMGEDGILLAAAGYDVTMYEQNMVVAALLKDALRRAKKHPVLKDIVSRMHLVEGDSIELLPKVLDEIDLIYLDPMFPEKQKSSLTGKKMQLIQQMEAPCDNAEELFSAALQVQAKKIIVKRPLKSEFLAGKEPNHSLPGKAIRYDIYVNS